jgi:molecular chaperone IbpA
MTKSMVVPDFRNSLRTLSIGMDSMWDRLWETIDEHSKGETRYPPYNVIKKSQDSYVIEIALAGFYEKDIDVELHSGVLKVSGKSSSRHDVDSYVYKGIGAREFSRSWTLAEHVQVESAKFVNGILEIHLKIEIPEEKKPKKILIHSE